MTLHLLIFKRWYTPWTLLSIVGFLMALLFHVTLLVSLDVSQGITKVMWIHPLGTINV